MSTNYSASARSTKAKGEVTMTILDPHLKQLAAARTTAEFDAAISALDSDLNEQAGQKTALLRAEDLAIFGHGDLATVRAAMADADANIALLEKAIEGAEKRRAEAAVAEHLADIEEIGADVKVKSDELAKHYRRIFKLVEELRPTLFAVDKLAKSVNQSNLTLEAAGRRDLMVNVTSIRRQAMSGPRAPVPDGISKKGLLADKVLQSFLSLGGVLDRRTAVQGASGEAAEVKGITHHAVFQGGSAD